jgi:diguanylate cyclase (GGDEF)-like protein
VALPYLLVLIATLAEIVGLLRQSAAPVTLIVIAAALAALVVRQLLVVLDNRRLAHDVMAQQEELTHRAFHDPLTGLANRALFYDRVAHALDLHHRDLRPVSVMFVDLDDFKSVNDAFGHDAGDAVLSAVAERLRAVVRTGDTVARLGGDEFAVLLEDDGDAALLAARLLDALTLPVAITDREVPVRASIGTATLDPAQPHTDIQDLLKRADLAMYAAKHRGKGTAVAFSPALRKGVEDDLELRIALHEDVRIGRVDTAFQPIVHTRTGELYALEALARWQHNGRAVPPVEFIPLADRGGFLAELDLLVARSALGLAASPQFAAGQVIVSTNVGLTRMSEAELPRRLRALLDESRVAPGRLVVEVSEQDLLGEARTVAALTALRDLGVCLAIDDFGVGYSNLSRLEALTPDIVKLDRSFVIPLADPDAPVKLLRRVIELAHDLGAVVVGEGVETPRQRDTLAALGCDAVQGFLIGAPASRVVEAAAEAV